MVKDVKNKPEIEEGMFYERTFTPTMARLTTETIDKTDVRILTLEDVNGEQMQIVGSKLIRKVCYYVRKYTDWKGETTCKPMMQLADGALEQVIQVALDTAEEEKKPIDMIFLLDHQDELISITSSRHSQISWAKLRAIIENPIKDIFGEDLVIEPFGSGRYSYKLPVKNKDVSSWVGIDVGNNLAEGRSGIRIFTRFRTESKGFGGAAPCLNWANLWQEPLAFFNVPVVRLGDMIGQENVARLNMQEIHLKNTAAGLKEIELKVREAIPNIVKALEEYLPHTVDESHKVKLTIKEMRAILEAYSFKVSLPKYVVDQILEVAKWQKDFTVWGFSSAISWVRTHGELKGDLDVDDRRVTRNLESVAGEILSLTPTIKQLKKNVGEITTMKLIDPNSETVEVKVKA